MISYQINAEYKNVTLKEPLYAEFTSQVFLNNSRCHYPVTELPGNVFLLNVAAKSSVIIHCFRKSDTCNSFMRLI